MVVPSRVRVICSQGGGACADMTTHRAYRIRTGHLHAARDIAAGDLILREAPLEVLCADDLDAATLRRLGPDPRFVTIWCDGKQYFQRFELACKLQHSCLPNTADGCKNPRPNDSYKVRALVPIGVGERLTRSCGLRAVEAPYSQRRAHLTEIHRDCDCAACTDPVVRAQYDRIGTLTRAVQLPSSTGWAFVSTHEHARKLAMHTQLLDLCQEAGVPADAINARAVNAFRAAKMRIASLPQGVSFVELLNQPALWAGAPCSSAAEKLARACAAHLGELLQSGYQSDRYSFDGLNRMIQQHNDRHGGSLPLLFQEDVIPEVDVRAIPGSGVFFKLPFTARCFKGLQGSMQSQQSSAS